ncbi:tRNA glutamyl-Q(34) synthetase GluQRS [Actinomyces polynesiensis]|uniref:tRNA glutamyl-Q(34) synthetase GluQRS n=1 Tax=Actinomyces polynesiensis TaxID=1325934 RepID=UPI0009E2C2C2|nr:tRNA glutamyl-Q(34) synthetase GluQRS [Actinomyces polynesiensis]
MSPSAPSPSGPLHGRGRVPAPGAGRFAPSPSGDLHVGNLRTAVLAWTWARRTGRRFVMRIEDIDRVLPGAAERQLEDLAAIGLDWDGEVLVQSTRSQAHRAALERLVRAGDVFECYCSRRDVREASSAPHVPPGHYPGTCLDLTEDQRRERRARLAAQGRRPSLRLRAPAPTWTVHDELHGDFTGPVDHFVVQRSDGVPAYNLAVVVDDGFQGVDQVTRGDDLLGQAPGQACLASLLGIPVPDYVHVPLAVTRGGTRLAKRDGAVTLADLRGLGWSPADVVGWIGESLGIPGARTASDIEEALDLHAMSLRPWVVEPPVGPPHP